MNENEEFNKMLTDTEARILGCLIEKEKSTPEYYPLTLNSLVAACNQKSNRNPVMQLEDFEVEEAIETLRENKWLLRVDTAGSRVPKYRHNISENLELYGDEVAIICVLLLRGPQTIGEIRNRTERLAKFENLEDVQDRINELLEEDRIQTIMKLPVQPGQKEIRFAHLLCGAPQYEPQQRSSAVSGSSIKLNEAQEEISMLKESLSLQQETITVLQDEVNTLKVQFQKFKEQFE